MAAPESAPLDEDIQTRIEVAQTRLHRARREEHEATTELMDLFTGLKGQTIRVQARFHSFLDTRTSTVHEMPHDDELSHVEGNWVEHQDVIVEEVLDDGVALRVADEPNLPIAEYGFVDFVDNGSDPT